MAESNHRFCTKCGNELPEGSEFCNKCGTKVASTVAGSEVASSDQPTVPLGSSAKAGSADSTPEEKKVLAEFTDAANPYAPEEPVDPNRSRRNLIIGVIAGIIVIAIAIVVAIIVHNNIVESEGGPSSEIIQMDPVKAIEQAEEEIEERQGIATPWGEVFDTDKVHWKVDGNEATLYDAADNSIVGMAFTTHNSNKSGETKQQAYIMGQAVAGGSSQDVHLDLYYLQNGKAMHWAAQGGQTAVQSGALTLADIADAIELNTASGLAPVAVSSIILTSDPEEGASSSYGSSNYSGSGHHPGDHADAHHGDTPFYGVWIGASKSESDAQDIANAATSKGFSAGCVLSSNWSNLNQDPWWCVTAGYCSSESEAKALCDKAKAAGYPDAYVKYSGNHHI